MSKWNPYVCWESEIPSDICDKIINSIHPSQYTMGTVGKDSNNIVDNTIRNVDIKFSDNSWINSMLVGYIMKANCCNFKYNLSDCDKEQVQISRYTKGKYYNRHTDFGSDSSHMGHTRKLSATVQLSDEESYDGGDFVLYHINDTIIAPRSKGTVFIFDSRIPHQVKPIICGVRFSLVKWYHGDLPLR
tara:strand:+ start:232 stop:795 length:564 start_codon:yes stop_codon:yes gene_type:complete